MCFTIRCGMITCSETIGVTRVFMAIKLIERDALLTYTELLDSEVDESVQLQSLKSGDLGEYEGRAGSAGGSLGYGVCLE